MVLRCRRNLRPFFCHSTGPSVSINGKERTWIHRKRERERETNESPRPTDRTSDDLDIIFSKLKDVKALEKFHPLLVQQLCYYSYFESLEKGVTRKNLISLLGHLSLSLRSIVFRTGDLGANWFAILSGTVDVCVPSENGKVSVFADLPGRSASRRSSRVTR